MTGNLDSVLARERIRSAENSQKHVINALIAFHYPPVNGFARCRRADVFAKDRLRNPQGLRSGHAHKGYGTDSGRR
jgi:hypothetical protein